MHKIHDAKQRGGKPEVAAGAAIGEQQRTIIVLLRDTHHAFDKYGIEASTNNGNLINSIRALEDKFASDLGQIISAQAELRSHTTHEWVQAISATTRSMFPDNFIVSLDSLLSGSSHFSLNLTKINGVLVNRPGAQSKEKQIEKLSKEFHSNAAHKRITLTEISGLTGQTLTQVASELKKAGLPVSSVILGAASEKAVEVFSNDHKDVQMIVLHPAARGLEMSKLFLIGGRRSVLNPEWADLIDPDANALLINLCMRYSAELTAILNDHDIDTAKIKLGKEVKRGHA